MKAIQTLPEAAGRAVGVERRVMPRWHEVEGHEIDMSRVVGVDPVESHSTGRLACDWAYGFRVRLDGNEVVILCHQPRGYGYAGSKITRKDYRARAEKMRQDFLDVLHAA